MGGIYKVGFDGDVPIADATTAALELVRAEDPHPLVGEPEILITEALRADGRYLVRIETRDPAADRTQAQQAITAAAQGIVAALASTATGQPAVHTPGLTGTLPPGHWLLTGEPVKCGVCGSTLAAPTGQPVAEWVESDAGALCVHDWARAILTGGTDGPASRLTAPVPSA